MIKNSVETAIDLLYDALLKSNPEIFVCTCKDCEDSIKALTLNNLAPLFYTSTIGRTFTHIENSTTQQQANYTAELLKSIKKVGENPNH